MLVCIHVLENFFRNNLRHSQADDKPANQEAPKINANSSNLQYTVSAFLLLPFYQGRRVRGKEQLTPQ